jgi:hypothetical protein
MKYVLHSRILTLSNSPDLVYRFLQSKIAVCVTNSSAFHEHLAKKSLVPTACKILI